MEERARGNIVARARVREPYYFVAFAKRMITMIDKENMSFPPVKGEERRCTSSSKSFNSEHV